MKTAATILGLTACAMTAMAGSPNLLQNPSFEVPGNPLLGEGAFANWETFGNVFQAEESMVDPMAPAPLDGNFTALTFGGFFGPGVQSDTGAFQIVDIPDAAGKTYRASVSVQSISADPLAPLDFSDPDGNGSFGHLPLLLLQFQDAAGNTISQPEATVFSASDDPFDTWITSSAEGVAPEGTVAVSVFCLFIQFGDDEGSLFWDSASLMEVEGSGPDCPNGEDDPDKMFVDSSAPWAGFMNVFELDGETYAFGSDWAIPDLQADFDDSVPSVTMAPVEIDDPSDFWYIGGNGGPGSEGNKLMEALLFQQTTGCLAGQNVTFSGFVQENSLDEDYEARIFIRDFSADFSTFTEASVPAEPGPFTVSLMTNPDPTRTVQWGFSTTGPNVWPGDAAGLGTVTFSSVDNPGGCNDADIAEPFDVLDLNDISAFITAFANQAEPADLAAPFGVFDLNDISAFVSDFTGGCP